MNTVERPFIDLNRVKAEISQIAATLNSFHAANLSYQSAQELNTDHSKLTLRTPAGSALLRTLHPSLRQHSAAMCRLMVSAPAITEP